MNYLQGFSISKEDLGYGLMLRLNPGWKDAAKKFPINRINNILKPEISIAQRVLDDSGLKETIEIETGEFPERAGLDLLPAQDSYISHNLSRASQVSALFLIVSAYLRDLNIIKPYQD